MCLRFESGFCVWSKSLPSAAPCRSADEAAPSTYQPALARNLGRDGCPNRPSRVECSADADESKTQHTARLCPNHAPNRATFTYMRHCGNVPNYWSRSFCIPSSPSMDFLFIRAQIHPTLAGQLRTAVRTAVPTCTASYRCKKAARPEARREMIFGVGGRTNV